MNVDRKLLYRFFNKETTFEEEKQIRLWVEESNGNRQEFFRERKLFDAILLHEDLTYTETHRRFYVSWRRVVATFFGIVASVFSYNI